MCLTIGDISTAISDIVGSHDGVFLVVDALDECSPDDRNELLKEIAKLQAKTTVRFMATSRGDLFATQSQFQEQSGRVCSRLEIKAVEEDIHSLIDNGLDDIKALVNDPQLRSSISERVTQAAGPLQVPKYCLQVTLH